ncbi:glycosyltransferase family 2 protein [Helicobacter sp. WB40]|uniref:glycosyltransferase family 2 protein n=1 Tax=Helicobacter sp. WB40 TaxID=3004130 RepID=UPI0022EC125C|nr:glycosyltransferase [Helicobacter sp. WB40]MDA3967720.1 glycosyltransferase [Helicobacter sp. WB40]
MKKSPKLSLLAPSFNHQNYVKYFLDSVLNQTCEDFELIIVDDCSSDSNIQIIESYKDKRIKLIKHKHNLGMNAALNSAFEKSTGEYLMFCASDDILAPNAIETMINAHNNSKAVTIYTKLIPIDINNNVVHSHMNGYLNMQKRSTEEFLRHTFLVSNLFVSPGMCVKREYFERIYPLPLSLCNYQDYKMHIDLLKFGEIDVLEERVVYYRLPSAVSGASAPSAKTGMREYLETHYFLDSYIAYDDLELLSRTFANEIEFTGIKPFKDTLEFFWGCMALCSPHDIRKTWGYHKIMNFYNTKEGATLLYKRYKFTFAHLLNLVNFFIKQ